jgi:hypothetical protein
MAMTIQPPGLAAQKANRLRMVILLGATKKVVLFSVANRKQRVY